MLLGCLPFLCSFWVKVLIMFCYMLLFQECSCSKQSWTIAIISLSSGKIDLFSVQNNNIISPYLAKIGKNFLVAPLKVWGFFSSGFPSFNATPYVCESHLSFLSFVWESGLREPKHIMPPYMLLLLWVINNVFFLHNDYNVFY